MTLRHIILVQPAIDRVTMQYMRMQPNDTEATTRSKVPMLLPQQVIDWQPGDGMNPEDFVLGQEGQVFVERDVPPGGSPAAILFQVEATGGEAPVTIRAPEMLGEISILVAHRTHLSLTPGSPSLKQDTDVDMGETVFQRWFAQGIPEGELVAFTVTGVPQGRDALWQVGAAALLVLALAATFFAARARKA